MITSICRSLNRSRNWLYKWIERYRLESPKWFQEKSRRPLNHATHTSYEVEQAVKMVRLELYNKGFFCGAQAISWELEDLSIRPVPSLSTINRILREASHSYFDGVLGYTEELLASCDFNHDPRSSIVDANQTRVSGKRLVKVLTWFDNEWGYANRMLDVAKFWGGLR